MQEHTGAHSSLAQALDAQDEALAKRLLAEGGPSAAVAAAAVDPATGEPLLVRMARTRNSVGLSLLLGAAVSLNARDAAGRTALYHACMWAAEAAEQAAAVKAAATGGSAPNSPTQAPGAAPAAATAAADAASVPAPSAGASEQQAPSSPKEALSKAEGLVRLLLQAGADPSIADSVEGFSPLHVLAHHPGTTGLVELLLVHGADPNARDQVGWACMHACKKRCCRRLGGRTGTGAGMEGSSCAICGGPALFLQCKV